MLAKNTRVKVTQKAVVQLRYAPDCTGIVVGHGRSPMLIRVLRDGLKTPITYHADFWEEDLVEKR